MQQVKLFKSVEADVAVLEQEINDWLSTEGVNVISIFGNIAAQHAKPESLTTHMGRAHQPSDVFVGVVYEKA